MTARDLARDIAALASRGFSDSELTQLHHFSLAGRSVSVANANKYFAGRKTLRGRNVDFAARCHYVVGQLKAGRNAVQTLIAEALSKWPLCAASVSHASHSAASARSAIQRPSSGVHVQHASSAKELGDAGEACARDLLRARGYTAELLATNHPTYDLRVVAATREFFVSVKVARTQQQVRLGSRRSVERLSDGNFVFAFIPDKSGEVNFEANSYRLLILPGSEARRKALAIHEAYWNSRSKSNNSNGFSVMVKATQHGRVWKRWLCYEDAWNLLPACKHEA